MAGGTVQDFVLEQYGHRGMWEPLTWNLTRHLWLRYVDKCLDYCHVVLFTLLCEENNSSYGQTCLESMLVYEYDHMIIMIRPGWVRGHFRWPWWRLDCQLVGTIAPSTPSTAGAQAANGAARSSAVLSEVPRLTSGKAMQSLFLLRHSTHNPDIE